MNQDIFGSNEPYDFHPIKITLSSEIETQLDGFHLSMTYGGVLEGRPDFDFNRSIIQGIKRFNGFGERKMLMYRADQINLNQHLPYFSCFAMLYSYTVCKDQFAHGSELLIHWFEDSVQSKPINQIIEEAVKEIDWIEHAEDFYF